MGLTVPRAGATLESMTNRATRRAKRRQDVKRLAKTIGNRSMGEEPRDDSPTVDGGNNIAAAVTGQPAERKGGKARAKKLGKTKLAAIIKKVEYARRKRGK